MKHTRGSYSAVISPLRLRLTIVIVAALLAPLMQLEPTGGSAATLRQGSLVNRRLLDDAGLKLGIGASLSGPMDSLGWRQVNAVQLAVDETNAAGGVTINGTNYTLELISSDSGCNPSQSVVAANTLIDAGVVAVIGHSCSSATDAAQSLYAGAGVPLIIASSTDPHLTDQGFPTTFRVITRDDSPPALLASHLISQLGHKRAAVLISDGFWGNWVGEVFADTFTDLGGAITSQHVAGSPAEFDAAMAAIAAEDPDAVHIAYDDGATAGSVSKAASDLGMFDAAIAWTTYTEDRNALLDYATAAAEAAEGDVAAMYYRATDQMPGYGSLNARYVDAGFEHYGDEAQMWGALAYDAARIVIAAMSRSASSTASAIRDAIAATSNHEGVAGRYVGFDKKGDVIPQWMWIEQHQNGQWPVSYTHLRAHET